MIRKRRQRDACAFQSNGRKPGHRRLAIGILTAGL
jgi:hypothetical protein